MPAAGHKISGQLEAMSVRTVADLQRVPARRLETEFGPRAASMLRSLRWAKARVVRESVFVLCWLSGGLAGGEVPCPCGLGSFSEACLGWLLGTRSTHVHPAHTVGCHFS